MGEHSTVRDTRLSPYQQELEERLQSVLDRLDRGQVTADSGLRIEREGRHWVLRLSVEARDDRIPGLNLYASPNQCILGFAQSEQLECHSQPGAVDNLIDEVVKLTERYLAGVTVIEHRDSRGRDIRKDFFFGLSSEGAPEARIGTLRRMSPRRVEDRLAFSFRFLKE